MSVNLSQNKHNLVSAQEIVVIEGIDGGIAIGNPARFRFIHMNNAGFGMEMLHHLKTGNIDVFNSDMLRILKEHNLLIFENAILEDIVAPLGHDICYGKKGEFTLMLPLYDGTVESDIYIRAISYFNSIINSDSIVEIGFHGHDPLYTSDNIKSVLDLVAKELCLSNTNTQVRYHLYTTLDKIDPIVYDWIAKFNIEFSVYFPIQTNVKNISDSQRDVLRSIKQLCAEGVRLNIITPVVKSNVRYLGEIATVYKKMGISQFDFPAIHHPSHPWKYGDVDSLPIASEYISSLLEVYELSKSNLNIFKSAKMIYDRIKHGGYSQYCSCKCNNITYIDNDGNIWPCLPARNGCSVKFGDLNYYPGQSYLEAREEIGVLSRAVKCEECIWKHLCGSFCILRSFDSSYLYSSDIITNYICNFRLELIKHIVQDMVRDLRKESGKLTSSMAGKVPGYILVMLQSDAKSIQYECDMVCSPLENLSANSLIDILLWAGNCDNACFPQLLFAAGNQRPLSFEVAKALEGLEDYIVLPLMDTHLQSKLNIPFSHNQLVVADGLDTIIMNMQNIHGRPIILHLDKTDIINYADKLLSIRAYIKKITIRIKTPCSEEPKIMKAYSDGLNVLAEASFISKTTDSGFDITNVDVVDIKLCDKIINKNDGIVIGPDAKLYKCVIDYRFGQREYSPGNIRVKLDSVINSDERDFLDDNRVAIKQGKYKHYNEYIKDCDIVNNHCNEIGLKAKKEQVRRISSSGYLFNCLHRYKAKQILINGCRCLENEAGAFIGFDVFAAALADIENTISPDLESMVGNIKKSDTWGPIDASSIENVFRDSVKKYLLSIEDSNQ